jgi:hypothetical protein
LLVSFEDIPSEPPKPPADHLLVRTRPASMKEPTSQVLIKPLTRKLIFVLVDLSYTVRYVKELIQNKEGISLNSDSYPPETNLQIVNSVIEF